MRLFDRFHPRYILPNAVTASSIVLGLAAIHTAASATTAAGFIEAAWFVLYTVLLDKLDGSVARAARASSEFGVQLDSFSDFLTFGVAPSFLMARALPWYLPGTWAAGSWHLVLLALGALYTVAAALRLAKFNITTAGNHPRYFRGLPSTSAGGILASGFLTHQQFDLPASWLNGLLAMMLLNAVLMVSNLPQPKLHFGKNKAWNAFQMTVVASVFIVIPLKWMPVYPFTVATLYTFGGFVHGLFHAKSILSHGQEGEQAAGA
jgi:CDP-diacylglycerol---serine O-phosphatidyltransferase